MFALSTSWNAFRHDRGEPIAEDIHRLGFKKIELNFSLTESMVGEIAAFAVRHGLEINSLHNYCPIPRGLSREEALPDCYSLASLDENERKKAVEWTKNTVSTAKKLFARAVVLHSGRVEIEDKTRQLINLHNQGKKNSQEYRLIFENFVAEREKKSAQHLQQLLKSLEELSGYAAGKNILLGIETRFYYREIPSFDEFGTIFKKFPGQNIVYWHDTGHAFVMEELGFMKKNSLLETYGAFLGGIHLHNIRRLIDHQAPADGDLEFRSIAPYIKKDTIKVIEVHPHIPGDAIKTSAEFLRGLLS